MTKRQTFYEGVKTRSDIRRLHPSLLIRLKSLLLSPSLLTLVNDVQFIDDSLSRF